MSLSTTAAGRRRDPVQERSQETVGRIQAAAARLLARGVAAQSLTTALIAAEAGLSVGALYRFYPDKQAIIDAIALSHLETFQDSLAAGLMAELPESPEALLARAVDGFADYLSEHPDFRTLAYGTPGQQGRAISAAMFEHQAGAGALAELLGEALGTLFGLEPDAEFPFRLRIAAEIGDRLIGHAFAQPAGPARERVLGEVKRILGAYLFP